MIFEQHIQEVACDTTEMETPGVCAISKIKLEEKLLHIECIWPYSNIGLDGVGLDCVFPCFLKIVFSI